MAKLSTEAKVGLFVLVGLLLFAALSVQVGGFRWLTERGYEVSVVVPSASGIDQKTVVEIAGIKVGEVKAIRLEESRARIVMRIQRDVRIPVDSQVAIKTRGLLGAKYIEIIPGSAHRTEPAAAGSPSSRSGAVGPGEAVALGRAGSPERERDGRFIPPGGEIRQTVPTVGTDQLVQQFSTIADDVKAVTASLRAALGTREGEQQLKQIVANIAELSVNLSRLVAQNDQKVASLIDNLEAFSRDLREVSSTNKQDVQATLANLHRFSDALADRSPEILANLQSLSTSLNELVKENRQNVTQGLENVKNAAARLDKTLESVASVTQKIDEGQGTLGRLVNDEEIAENLSAAAAGIGELLGTTQRLRTSFGFRSEYQTRGGDTKTAVSLELAPGPDRSYLLEIVSNPFGRRRISEQTTTFVASDGTVSTSSSRSVSSKENELQVTFLIQKWWGPFGLRGGIIENSGAAGLGYSFFDRRLELRADAFNFLREGGPNIRAEARYHFLRHLYAVAGGENLLDDGDISGPRRTLFLGGGFTFEDRDLAALIRQAPTGALQ